MALTPPGLVGRCAARGPGGGVLVWRCGVDALRRCGPVAWWQPPTSGSRNPLNGQHSGGAAQVPNGLPTFTRQPGGRWRGRTRSPAGRAPDRTTQPPGQERAGPLEVCRGSSSPRSPRSGCIPRTRRSSVLGRFLPGSGWSSRMSPMTSGRPSRRRWLRHERRPSPSFSATIPERWRSTLAMRPGSSPRRGALGASGPGDRQGLSGRRCAAPKVSGITCPANTKFV